MRARRTFRGLDAIRGKSCFERDLGDVNVADLNIGNLIAGIFEDDRGAIFLHQNQIVADNANRIERRIGWHMEGRLRRLRA